MEKITVKDVTSRDEKSNLCESVLRALPNWFGNEKAIVSYTREVRDMPVFAAFTGDGNGDGEVIGFAALKNHNEYTAEVCVMGVLPPYHRHGAGRALIERCMEECGRAGRMFLTVKTLDQLRVSTSYDKTRLFYHAMGFRPLQVFPEYWDADNPCLFMAMYLGRDSLNQGV